MSTARERILVLLPYGMNFRNIVLNDEVWSQLTTRYEVDVLTPLHVESPEELGVRRVFRYTPRRLSGRLSLALLRAEFYLRYLSFYLELGLSAELNIVYHRWLRTPRARRLFLFLGSIGTTRLGRAVGRLLAGVRPLDGEMRRIVRTGRYALVVCTHTHELVNILASRAAHAAGVPVACVLLGLDNLINHGPMIMCPDLLLVWGRRQCEEFEEYQRRFEPRSKSVRVEAAGNLVYDVYSKRPARSRAEFLRSIGVEQDRRIVLLTVTAGWFIPNQVEIAETIVEAIRKTGENALLLVRPRVGFDEELWRTVGERFGDVVRVQRPIGRSYDIAPSDGMLRRKEELEAIQQFVDTMHHAELVVTSTPSTIWLDALLFNRPVITVGYNAGLDRSPTPLRSWLECRITRPYLNEYVVAESPERLAELVADHLSGRRVLSPARRSLLEDVAGVSAVSGGARVLAGLDRLAEGRRGGDRQGTGR